MRDDLINASPIRKAFHWDLRLVFPTHNDFSWFNNLYLKIAIVNINSPLLIKDTEKDIDK